MSIVVMGEWDLASAQDDEQSFCHSMVLRHHGFSGKQSVRAESLKFGFLPKFRTKSQSLGTFYGKAMYEL